MKLANLIAVLCEGTAEETIINILLDNHRLIFEREELLEEKPLRIRQASKFETTYLRKGFDEKISIIRILDSKNENFRLSKAYSSKVNVINIITAPEIEMLIILKENKYKEYCKSHLKPSQFCINHLRMKNVKNKIFLEKYFQDVDTLIDAIDQYQSMHIKNGELTLKDIIR